MRATLSHLVSLIADSLSGSSEVRFGCSDQQGGERHWGPDGRAAVSVVQAASVTVAKRSPVRHTWYPGVALAFTTRCCDCRQIDEEGVAIVNDAENQRRHWSLEATRLGRVVPHSPSKVSQTKKAAARQQPHVDPRLGVSDRQRRLETANDVSEFDFPRVGVRGYELRCMTTSAVLRRFQTKKKPLSSLP